MRLACIRKRVDSYALSLQRRVIVDALEKDVRNHGLLSQGDQLLDYTYGDYMSHSTILPDQDPHRAAPRCARLPVEVGPDQRA